MKACHCLALLMCLFPLFQLLHKYWSALPPPGAASGNDSGACMESVFGTWSELECDLLASSE